MLRCGVCFAALALGAVIASPLFADEVDDVIKKADSLRYSPAEHGLKDLKVEVKNSMFAMQPMLAKMQVYVYWKAPDKSTSKAEGVDPAMAAQLAPMLEGMKQVGKMIVPESLATMRDRFDYTIESDGGQTVLVGVPKPGTDEAAAITKMKTYFDDRGLPSKIVSEGQGASNMEMTYLEKDGKFLIETSKGDVDTGQMGVQPMSMSFTYTEIDGMWFPDVLTQEVMGMKIEISFAGYEINKGVDDSLFGGDEDKKEEAPKEEGGK